MAVADKPARAFDLPFREQAEFWRRKVNVPTASWRDLQREDHAHGFMVAGAARQDLLDDLRKAVDKAITGGGTIADFRRDFDVIVGRTGWAYNGGRNWRTSIIYKTNLRTAYQAGRWQQMQAIKHRRPFWQYVHNDVVHPRPEHLAWNGTVLHADDPWWTTHYTPNGYGCECTVITLAPGDLARLGKSGPDQAPTAVDDTTGLDPGFDYNVGTAASSVPAAARFGAKVMQLPPPWRTTALADAQRRPADLFADWPGTLDRVTHAKASPPAVARAVGFLRPAAADGLEGAATALLGVDEPTLFQILQAAGTGANGSIVREQLTQLPQWLASAETTVLCHPGGEAGSVVYARALEDGRYVRAIFGLGQTRAKVLGNWLQTVDLVAADALRADKAVVGLHQPR